MVQFGVAYFIMLLAMYYDGNLMGFRSVALLKVTMSIDSSRRGISSFAPPLAPS
jgi:hypothetical protein